MSASCEGYEHRVVLSSVGFSRGVHYWELTIDRYHSDTDPAFGIARADVSRDQMLGKSNIVALSLFLSLSSAVFLSGKGEEGRAVYPAPMKYSCATRYTPEIPDLFGNSEARDVCTMFSLCFFFLYLSLFLSLICRCNKGKRRLRDSESARLCKILNEKDTLIPGHEENRSMLLELMKIKDRV